MLKEEEEEAEVFEEDEEDDDALEEDAISDLAGTTSLTFSSANGTWQFRSALPEDSDQIELLR